MFDRSKRGSMSLDPSALSSRLTGSPNVVAGRAGSERRFVTGLIILAGAFVLATGAGALVTYWRQGAEAAQLLAGLNAVRSNVRAIYNSKNGYGIAGIPIEKWGNASMPSGWSKAGQSIRHNQGGMVEIKSASRSFSVKLEGLSPIVCWLVLPRLDNGWTQIKYAGVPLSTPATGTELRSACGYLANGTLELKSAE